MRTTTAKSFVYKAWQSIALRDSSSKLTSSIVEYASNCVNGVRWTRTCTKKIPVELLQNVDGLGLSGEVAHVSAGYARNYLVPGRMARPLVAGGHAMVNSSMMSKNTGVGDAVRRDDDEDVVAEKKRRKKLEGIVRKLTESVVLFKKDDAGGGVLAESIRRADIVEAVGKQLGIEIVEGLLDMEDEDVLTTVGDFVIPLKLVVKRADREGENVMDGGQMRRGGSGEERARLQIRVLEKNAKV